jgi:hypothetical protein
MACGRYYGGGGCGHAIDFRKMNIGVARSEPLHGRIDCISVKKRVCRFDQPTPLRLAGTRSRAIRRRTSKEGANGKTGQGKSLSSDSARAYSPKAATKKHRDVQRRTRGSASLPAPAERLDPIISGTRRPSGRYLSIFYERARYAAKDCWPETTKVSAAV